MTADKAKELLEEAAADEQWTDEEAEEMFRALYERAADAEDREAGVISLCYAALAA